MSTHLQKHIHPYENDRLRRLRISGDADCEKPDAPIGHTGVFVPESQPQKRAVVRKWLTRTPPVDGTPPLVVAEETYTRHSIESKLGADKYLVRILCELGILRPETGSRFTQRGQPVSAVSLAQALSWCHQVPVGRILISESAFTSSSFRKRPPAARISALFQAYSGSCWFETFRKRQARIATSIARPPHVFAWQRIRLSDLPDWFLTSRLGDGVGTLVKLVEKGFIAPRKGGRFRRHSVDNLVDNRLLAELVARLHNVSAEEVWSVQDPFLERVAEEFALCRLLPYMLEHSIGFHSVYSLKACAERTGIRLKRLREAARSGVIPNTIYVPGQTKVQGVDLAVYALSRKNWLVFTAKDVASLLGTKRLNLQRLGFRSTGKGTFSRHHYVFPIYDVIADRAIKQVMARHMRGKPFTIAAAHAEVCIPGLTQCCERLGAAELGADFLRSTGTFSTEHPAGPYPIPDLVRKLKAHAS